MDQRLCRECGDVNAGLGPVCRVCGAPLDAVGGAQATHGSRLARHRRTRSDGSGIDGSAAVDAETASKAATRSLDLALYGLVGFGLIFGLAAVLKGFAARTVLVQHDIDRSVIAKANWAIALGVFDIIVAPGLGFLIVGGIVYSLLT
jgi:hypothetical protein